MKKILEFFKKYFYVRIGQPVEDSQMVRFSTTGLTLMRITGKEEVQLPEGDYSLIKVENPYGEVMAWGLVIGTDLGAASACWEDFEEKGLVKVLD